MPDALGMATVLVEAAGTETVMRETWNSICRDAPTSIKWSDHLC